MRVHVWGKAAILTVLSVLTTTAAPAMVASASAAITYDVVGDPYTTMTYYVSGFHRGTVISATAVELLMTMRLSGDLSSVVAPRSCSDWAPALVRNFSCDTASNATCPYAQGSWRAVSDFSTGFQSFSAISGPLYTNCYDAGGGGGGCKSTTQWTTTVVDLTTGRRLRSAEEEARDKRGAHQLTDEIRVDHNGDKEFILDQWALIRTGNVERSSALKVSVDWLNTLPSVPRDRPLLVIQEPVHTVPMPKPLIRFDRVAANEYVRSVKPALSHATITARLEFAPDGALLSKEVLKGNPQIGAQLADLVSLESLQGHSHRAIVFATFEVMRSQARLLGAETALAKCCCGTHFCN